MEFLNQLESFFKNTSKFFEQNSAAWPLLLSIVLLVIYYLVRRVLLSNIEKKAFSKSERKFLKNKILQYFNYFTLLILFLVWFSKLQVFFVSLFAVAAAIVLAFKELIMCLTGGLLIKSSRPFKVGHRIEINNIRGFVLASTWLTTKVLEVGPEKHSQQTTGDIITVPNSLMLANAVKDESYFNGYSVKVFKFRVEDLSTVEEIEKGLLEQANNLSKDYISEAKESISKFCKREGVSIPSLEPRSKIIFDDDDSSVILLIKMPAHNTTVADIEQSLNRHFIKLSSKIAPKS